VAGYSGSPLVAKLGIRPGVEFCVVEGPADYLDLVSPLPEGARRVESPTGQTEFVHVFSTEKAKLAKALATYREKLPPTAAVWVSWPKKSSKVPTDITEDTIRELALPLGFVDIKVCAVTEVWSGLKLVVRRELRPA